MYDSDLVETLSLLQMPERARFLAFLRVREDDSLASEAIILSEYIFACLDQFGLKMQSSVVWEYLTGLVDGDEEALGLIEKEALELLKMGIRQIKKRLPKVQDNLQYLISSLSQLDQKNLLNIIQKNEIVNISDEVKLIKYCCVGWNEYCQALSESVVYPKLFGDEKQVSGKLAKYRSSTLKKLRRFIAIEVSDRNMNELQELVCLQKFFRERNNVNQYNRIRGQVLNKKAGRNAWASLDYYNYFVSDATEYDFQSDKNEKANDLNLWNTLQSLDEYYLMDRLWYSCQLLNQNQVAPLALPPLKEWQHINTNAPRFKWFFDKPIGKAFILALDLLSDEKGEDHTKLKNFISFIRNNESEFSNELINSFEIFACNYAIRRMNRGDFFYGEILFDIHQHRTETERIYVDGKILAGELQTITILGLRLNRFDWVKEFIENNKKKISGVMPSIRHYQFCLAQYLYAIKKLLPALDILMNCDFEDIHCKMVARILEIKVLYELDAAATTRLRVADQLDERIEATIIFFFRLKNVPPTKKIMGKRFADFMKKIRRAAGNRRLKLLEKIRHQVETIDYIAERQWLLRILDELIEKLKKGGRR